MNESVERIRSFNQGRNPHLLQLKYQLMQSDVFAFFRGTCHLFYQDWPSDSPLNQAPGAWICGDLHVQNLGCYKGDNRLVYFNINDFDEAVYAPCTWDLARFLTCLLLIGPTLKINEAKVLKLCDTFLDVSTTTLARGRVRLLDDDNAVGPAKDLIFHVKRRPRAAFLDAHTEKNGSTRKLINGKQTQPVTEAERAKVTALIQQWATQQHNPPFFTLLDVAHRIAGIGSLGVERYVLLVEGKGSPDRNYLLDLKAESSSSLQPYLPVRQPDWHSQAERCVDIQSWVQGIPPALLSAVQMDEQGSILRELQPLEDKVHLEPVTDNMPQVTLLVNTIAKVIAWGQLRSAGRQGAADANALIDFAHAPSHWQKEVLHVAKHALVQVNEDYQTFRSAYRDGKFKTDGLLPATNSPIRDQILNPK